MMQGPINFCRCLILQEHVAFGRNPASNFDEGLLKMKDF